MGREKSIVKFNNVYITNKLFVVIVLMKMIFLFKQSLLSMSSLPSSLLDSRGI